MNQTGGADGADRADADRSADIVGAMRSVDRARFLPPDQVAHAREDRALPLFHGQTGSQPSTVAAMLRLLQVPVGSAGLNIERTSYLASGRAIEFTRSIYRGDMYDFVAELRLGEAPANGAIKP